MTAALGADGAHDPKETLYAARDVPASGAFRKRGAWLNAAMATTRQNVTAIASRRAVREVYVPAAVAMVVGWPGHSGLSNRPSQAGPRQLSRSDVLEELLRRGLAVAESWEAAA